MAVQGLNWFSKIQMDNLKVIVDLLGADVQRKLLEVKPKYAIPFEIIRKNYETLEKINAAVTEKGPYILNDEGKPLVDENAKVKFIPELDDKQVIQTINEMTKAAETILAVSKNEFTANNEKGIKLLQLENICKGMTKSHEDTKQKMQVFAMTEHFKNTINKEIPYRESKNIVWFEEKFIKKLEDAYKVLEAIIFNDPDKLISPAMAAEPRGKNVGNHGGLPDVFEPAQSDNKHLHSLNALYANIQQLKNINNKISELGVYGVVKKNDTFKFDSSDIVDDARITTLSNGVLQEVTLLLANVKDQSSPEYQALITLKDNNIFTESSARKNHLNQEFFTNFYKNNPPPLVSSTLTSPSPIVPTTETAQPATNLSTLTNSSPVVPASRDGGLLHKNEINIIKPILIAAGWTVSDLKTVNNEQRREVSKNNNGVEKSFIINPREMRTTDSSLETFKAMLQCFEATHNKLPTITTANQELKDKWINACKEVFPEKKIDFDSMISVKKTPAPETPKPEPTPDEPDTHFKMRP
jgi:hypothetical protein